MTYAVKEIFRTLQGEGVHSGRPSVFGRFTGCNLWSGREEDRSQASCRFCDTDFVGTDGNGGGRFSTASDLADAVERAWGGGNRHRNVVFTGGEPLLQLDAVLIDAVHARGFECAIETNGTQEAPVGIDWVCVSPKAGMSLRLIRGDEIKVVFPQSGIDLKKMAELDFRHYWLSPMDGVNRIKNTRAAIEYCLEHPQWRLNLQSHKLIGIP